MVVGVSYESAARTVRDVSYEASPTFFLLNRGERVGRHGMRCANPLRNRAFESQVSQKQDAWEIMLGFDSAFVFFVRDYY